MVMLKAVEFSTIFFELFMRFERIDDGLLILLEELIVLEFEIFSFG